MAKKIDRIVLRTAMARGESLENEAKAHAEAMFAAVAGIQDSSKRETALAECLWLVQHGYSRAAAEKLTERKPAGLQRYFQIAKAVNDRMAPPAPYQTWGDAWHAMSLENLVAYTRPEREKPQPSDRAMADVARILNAARNLAHDPTPRNAAGEPTGEMPDRPYYIPNLAAWLADYFGKAARGEWKAAESMSGALDIMVIEAADDESADDSEAPTEQTVRKTA